MKKHTIKIEREYFNEVLSGNKTFEIRKNDRDYKQSDDLILLEVVNGKYTRREICATVGYVCDYAQQDGYVVFSVIR